MAGGTIAGTGFQPIVLDDRDLANLHFDLVDSNYKPIKMLSPMFVTLKIEPAEDPAQDISIWKGKLPKNAPTPQEKAAMEAQQRAQQDDEARKKAQMDYLSETLAKVLNNMAAQQQQIDQMQSLQQPIQQPVQQPVQPVQQPIPNEVRDAAAPGPGEPSQSVTEPELVSIEVDDPVFGPMEEHYINGERVFELELGTGIL
jgi:hypothetical protein